MIGRLIEALEQIGYALSDPTMNQASLIATILYHLATVFTSN